MCSPTKQGGLSGQHYRSIAGQFLIERNTQYLAQKHNKVTLACTNKPDGQGSKPFYNFDTESVQVFLSRNK